MRFFIYLSRIFLALAIVFGLLIALLPTLISTQWGREQTLFAINSWIPGHLDIHSWQLHWGKPQVLEGVVLTDANDQSVLEIEHLSVEAPLWRFFTKQLNLGMIHIHGMGANLILARHSWMNLENALGLSKEMENSLVSPFQLSHVNADFQLFDNGEPFFIRAEGVTQQQELKGSFDLSIQLNGLLASNWKDLKKDVQQYFQGEIKEDIIQVNIQHFPTKILDDLAELKEERFHAFFQSFLGNHFNLMINKEKLNEDLLVSIQAPLVKGEIKGYLQENVLTLLEPAIFHFDFAPQVIDNLTQSKVAPQASMPVQVIFPYLSFPLVLLNQPSSIDFCQCGFKIDANIGSIDINIKLLGVVNVHHLEMQLVSLAKDRNMHFKWTGYAEFLQKPLHINFQRLFEKPTNLAAFLEKPKLKNVSAVVPPSKKD